jgi:two-component system, cell cycle response regulator
MLPMQPDDLPELKGLDEPDQTTQYALMPGARPTYGDEEWALIRYVGQPVGEVIPLRAPAVTLGRGAENSVVLPEAEVSRLHARMDLLPQEEDGGYAIQIMDLGSMNGTYVNGRRLETPNTTTPLHHGDVIRVGGHAFKLKCLDELERHYHEAILAQTSIDPLTCVNNRSTVLAYLEKQVDLARRYHRNLSLILCDLDHFKDVNDNYGHATGDLVLQRFGSIALTRLRGSDLVGRIGGEEFLIVLPETPSREAANVAEDLRQTLASEEIIPWADGEPFHVTCCFGLAQLRERDIDNGSLLARADVALYRAKALGRNRVEVDE